MTLPSWLTNRKFMAPILAGLATILVTVLQANLPSFALSTVQMTQFLTFIWGAGVAIAVGDMGYDWLGQIAEIVGILLEARKTNIPG